MQVRLYQVDKTISDQKQMQTTFLLCWHWLWSKSGRKKKYGIDFQYHFFYGRSNLDNGIWNRYGHVFLLGFNLYWNK